MVKVGNNGFRLFIIGDDEDRTLENGQTRDVKKMKIVYVVHEFPPDLIGGTGVAAYQVAKDMFTRGHNVWVLSQQSWVDDSLPSIGFFDEKVDGLSVRRLIFDTGLS
ncbi:MAG: hypothetical protein ACETWM_19730, partial [Candidatus Lokiarchaeia archaeon]